jgi:hypothetical protein
MGKGGISSSNIKGFDTLIKNLNKEILQITLGSRDGLLHAAKHIRRQMDITPPLIPIDTGNLINSWQVNNITEGGVGSRKFGLMIGFSANYALWVHEMVDADFTSPRMRKDKRTGKMRLYTPREGAGAHFLSAALDREHDTILQIIASNSKVK